MSESDPSSPQSKFSVRFGRNDTTDLHSIGERATSSGPILHNSSSNGSSRSWAIFGGALNRRRSSEEGTVRSPHISRRAAVPPTRNFRSRVPSYTGGVVSREDESPRVSRSCCSSCSIFAFLRLPPLAQDRLSAFINSSIWKCFLISFTILLLFGAKLQDLSVPKDVDLVFDILFSIALCVFGLDIIFRCMVEPQYLEFQFKRCGKTRSQLYGFGCCLIPSMLFWCDFLSTITLFYDLSGIKGPRFLMKTITIKVSDNGKVDMVKSLGGIYDNFPVNLNANSLITVVRTLRVFRFFRASTVSVINWYWLYQRINPLWYWRRYKRTERRLKGDGEMRKELPFGSISRNSSVSWEQYRMSSLAAVEKNKMEEEQKKWNLRNVVGIKQILRLIGIRRSDHEEILREVAATKIQRAWKKTINHGRVYGATGYDHMHSEHDAWAPSNEFKINPVETRRSLRPYTGSQANPLTMSVRARMNTGTRRQESQVGSAMRELTGHRVAIFIILALILTVLFTYTESDATPLSIMVVLHMQVKHNMSINNRNVTLSAARDIVHLYHFKFNGTSTSYSTNLQDESEWPLRERESLEITVIDEETATTTVGLFDQRNELRNSAFVEILSTMFIVLVWFFGVTAFAGPVMTLVVIPIERMVRLLTMLMLDPLGYQSTARYKKFVSEEDELSKNSRWTKDVLKGMETHFLMSTILRIGSLMKVGFGSAGVEIIRSSLQRGQSKNVLNLDTKGSSVSCIFLFCDIRQFTDATESLQEEVFVFTNRIAAVVHSICHAYGGSANKNIGDAFLLSWPLEDENSKRSSGSSMALYNRSFKNTGNFTAKNNQADKALLAVVKISLALYHDKFYIETMSEVARDALLEKLSERKGPVVQMGFGLHAGTAVQGAIGSQRKIDATYVSESVELAEFLESSTKKYGLKMLMSGNFHRLLNQNNRRRCRKVDQILMLNDEEESEELAFDESDVMELFTFDMDIDALWVNSMKKGPDNIDTNSDTDSSKGFKGDFEKKPSVRHIPGAGFLKDSRRRSMNRLKTAGGQENQHSEELKPVSSMAESAAVAAASVTSVTGSGDFGHTDESSYRRLKSPELVLPTGPALYNANIWLNEDMRKIREKFSKDFPFFQKFNSGLQSYYAKDWQHAKQCFETILVKFDDGPSRYFLECIQDNDDAPPPNFLPYGTS